MTIPDNSLWGFIKGQVSGIRYETIDQLKHAIIAAFASVSRNSLQENGTKNMEANGIVQEQ